MLINSSKDVFWLVLSFVILWIGICIGFACFYMALMLRDSREVVRNIKKKLEFIDTILSMFKKKAENTANYIPPLIDTGKKIYEAIKEKQKDQKTKNKKKK